MVRNARLDHLGTNRLGRALYAPLFDSPAGPPNSARFVFLDPRSPDSYGDWERTADDLVAILRTEAGRNPYDKGLTALIGELSTRSEEPRTCWGAHYVRLHRTGSKTLHHPVVGDLELAYEVMELPADPGLVLNVYTVEPASPSADALNLLASWAAIEVPAGSAPAVQADLSAIPGDTGVRRPRPTGSRRTGTATSALS